MHQHSISIPDPDEAAKLLAFYSGNPITEAAVTALEAFGTDLDPGTAANLLRLWPHYPELTDRERAAVVAHFVGNSPDPTSTDILVSRAVDATLKLTPEQADQVLGLAAHLLFDQIQADEHKITFTELGDGVHWRCVCGAGGVQPDPHQAEDAANWHLANPEGAW